MSNAFKYCWTILGYRKEILLNWLIDQLTIKDIGEETKFNLRDGRKVVISVDYETDTFTVIIKLEAGEIIDSVKNVFLGQLVYTTDEHIRKTANYQHHHYKESVAV